MSVRPRQEGTQPTNRLAPTVRDPGLENGKVASSMARFLETLALGMEGCSQRCNHSGPIIGIVGSIDP